MTSIVALENIDNLDEKFILTEDIFKDLTNDLSFAGFKVNEEVSYRDILYGALLPSGADATHTLAIKISGSEEEYVKLMNQKATELGLTNTHFTNSIGIESSDNNHFSTVKDVAKLLIYALKNKEFKKIYKTDTYLTTDKLLTLKSSKYSAEKKYETDLSIISGSKTGYTSKAGLCLSSISLSKTGNLLLVTTNATKDNKINHFLDAKNIYQYYHNNYKNKQLIKKGQLIKKIKTNFGEIVSLKSKNTIKKYLPNNSNISYIYKGKKVINKSIKKNDKIGKYIIKNNNKTIYEEDVYSPINVHFYLTKRNLVAISIITLIILTLLFIHRVKKIRKKY